MYERDLPKIPIQISREDFIYEIFSICKSKELHYDIMISAVAMADTFICDTRGFNCDWIARSYDFMCVPAPKIYSIELAHIVIVLFSKLYDENRYPTRLAVVELKNCYIYKLEWEIVMSINYKFDVKEVFSDLYIPSTSLLLHCLTYDICLYKLWNFDIKLICISVILLNRHSKLRAQTYVKKIKFMRLLNLLKSEYDTEYTTFCAAYIKQ